MDSIIKTYLIWQHGNHVYPKADGRIEVPQPIVSKMNWQRLEKIYITANCGEIIISSKKPGMVGKTMLCKISKNRIRVPATLTREVGFSKTPVYMVLSENKVIIRSNVLSQNTMARVNSLLEKFPNEHKEELLDIFRNKSITNGIVIPDHIENIYDNAQPELILPDVTQPIVFRITGAPTYVGTASYVTHSRKLIFTFYGGYESMYLVPGIHIARGGYRIGFLLINCWFQKQMANLVIYRNASEIIIWYDTSRTNNFKLCVNPPTVLRKELLKKAESMCSNPIKFVEKTFKFITAEEFKRNSLKYGHVPTLVKQNIVIGGNNEYE